MAVEKPRDFSRAADLHPEDWPIRSPNGLRGKIIGTHADGTATVRFENGNMPRLAITRSPAGSSR
jgi:hypothetical protein